MYGAKILVIGPFNAGKTTLIKTLSELSMTTERDVTAPYERRVKPKTTVAMDFGIVRLDDGFIVRLFGTPGQRRFSFMWQVLSRGMHGYILILDSADEASVAEAGRIYSEFKSYNQGTPHILAANKQDMEGAMAPEDIRLALEIPEEVPVLPTVARNHASAWSVLKMLLSLCIERGVVSI